LLWAAAGLSALVGNYTIAIAVLLVISLNALFAFVQELQAERAVEARTLRDGAALTIDAGAVEHRCRRMS
jgi:magnesium-transporting ATPase (P-type)